MRHWQDSVQKSMYQSTKMVLSPLSIMDVVFRQVSTSRDTRLSPGPVYCRVRLFSRQEVRRPRRGADSASGDRGDGASHRRPIQRTQRNADSRRRDGKRLHRRDACGGTARRRSDGDRRFRDGAGRRRAKRKPLRRPRPFRMLRHPDAATRGAIRSGGQQSALCDPRRESRDASEHTEARAAPRAVRRR